MTYTKTILPQNEGENTQNNDKSKYEKALELYETNLNDAEVQAAVKQIIEEKVPQNDTRDVKKFLFGSIELTTLSTIDTEEKVLRMVEKVNRFDREYPDIPHVAAVCVYPVFTELVSKSLEVDGVEITNGTYYDTGDKLEYIKTVVDFGLKHQKLGPALRQFLQSRINGENR